MNANLLRDWHHIYLERMPVWNIGGMDVVPDKSLFMSTYRAGVRLTKNKDGSKDATLSNGSIIKTNFYNGSPGVREHRVFDNEIWYGRVESASKEWLDATATDFCVLVTKPRQSKQYTSRPEKDIVRVADQDLPTARIEVKVDPTAGKRELTALSKFCNERYQPELLDQIRLAFASDPSRAPPEEYADLTWGPKHARSEENHQKWEAMMAQFEAGRRDNPSQIEVLKSASKMTRNIVAVAGPPGAGKTRTHRDKCIALLKIKHKILCVATANVAVETDAMAVWDTLTKEEWQKYKCLRLESGGAEEAAILSKVNYAAYANKEGDEDKLPEYIDRKTAQDDHRIRNALDKLASDFAARQSEMKDLMAQYHTVDKVYQALKGDRRLKRSNVALGMTLDYRIWELTLAD